MLTDEPPAGLRVKRSHGPGRPQDVVAQRVSLEERILKFVEDAFGRRVQVALDFVDDYLAFLFDFVLGGCGVNNQVAEQFAGPREVFREEDRVECRILFGGERIEIAADRFHALVHVERVAVLGPFEKDMFDEMGQPELRRRYFVARAAVHHEPAPRDGG